MSEIDEPRTARSRRTRTALLDAALALLEEGELDALTMGSVARRAGISRRGAYLHFASRAELVGALFGHAAAEADLEGSLAPVLAAEDGEAALTAWARHLARYHPRLLAVDRAVERVRHRDPDAARHHARVHRDQWERCRWLIGRVAAEGRLAPPWTVDTATEMLWALISSEVIGGLLGGCGWSTEALAEHLAVMYRATFLAPS